MWLIQKIQVEEVLSDRDLICPLLIYAKSDQEDATRRELRALLTELKQELSSTT